MIRSYRALGLVIGLLLGCGKEAAHPDTGTKEEKSAPVVAAGVRWVGRVDAADAGAPRFAWSGSGFVATVSGAAISVSLRTEGTSEPVFFRPVVDGTPGERFSVTGEQTVALGKGLGDGDHRVELYRETEGRYGSSVFLGFTEGTLKDPPAGSNRLIEVVGDSISAGYGNLGTEEHPNYGDDPNGGCHFTTQTESAYETYGAIAARQLGADASIIAVSGWGAYRDNTSSRTNVLSSVYGNAVGLLATPAWTFPQRADVVVVNLGTNDFANNADPGEAEFKSAYSALLDRIRSKHPRAYVFCMIGPLMYGTGLSQATAYVTAVVEERRAAGDERIELLNFGQQNGSLGTGCDWHPNVTVQTQMADSLVAAIKNALAW
jgi:lysophospholipase L1-like esterase